MALTDKVRDLPGRIQKGWETQRGRVRSRPVVLKPYSGHPIPLVRRIAVWSILPIIVFFCLPYGFFYALYTPYLIVMFAAPVAIVMALTIWALPDMKTYPARSLVVLYFAYLASLILWPNYLAIALPGLPWITLLRLFGFPMTLALLICISVSPVFRTEMMETLKPTPLIWKGVVLFVLLQLISIPFSHKPVDSVSKFLVVQVDWIAIFFVSCYVFRRPGRPEAWAYMVWAMAIVIGAIGLREYSNEQVLWAGHIPSFLKINDETVNRILEGSRRDATGQYRIASTATTSLGLAEYTSLCLPFVLHFISWGRTRLVRLAALASVPMLLLVIIETDARLGMVGFFMSVLIYLLFWSLRLWRERKDSLVGAAIVLAYPVVFTMMVASTFFVGRIRNKIWGGGQYNDSNAGRMAQVNSGLPMIATHPLGHGVGMGGEVLGYKNPAGTGTIDSYYLLIGLEYGLLGFLVYFGVFLIAIWLSSRVAIFAKLAHRDYAILVPTSVALINFFVIKSIFSNDDNHPLAFMMLGLVVAVLARMKKDPAVQAAAAPAAVPARAGVPRRVAIAAGRAG